MPRKVLNTQIERLMKMPLRYSEPGVTLTEQLKQQTGQSSKLAGNLRHTRLMVDEHLF